MIETKATVHINASAEEIWKYVIRLDDWWLRSNPREHIELSLIDADEIKQGTRFNLKEYIAGIRGEAIAEVSQMVPLQKLVWKSIEAKYYLICFSVNIEEGGEFELVENPDGCMLSHHVWGRIQMPLLNKIVEWFFKNMLKGEKKDYEHTYRELLFVKDEIETRNT